MSLNEEQPQQPLLTHLAELRDRILRALASIVAIFICLAYFSSQIYTFVAAPLMAQMPKGASMIATDVAAPFLTPIKLTLVLSFFIAIPYVLHQIWAFIAPGLYKHERRLVMPLLVSSSLLFYCGIIFAYYVIFPVVFGFFSKVAPVGIQVATDITSYLDFVLALFIAFGVAFEVPILIILLCWTKMTTPKALAQKRPYIIVLAFIVGMLLTPPDMLSQTLLAIPMCLLFELGLFLSRFYIKTEQNDEQDNLGTDGENA